MGDLGREEWRDILDGHDGMELSGGKSEYENGDEKKGEWGVQTQRTG